MNKVELQQRHQLGALAPVLSDIASCMRETSPFHALNTAYDAVQAARQLGRNEGWQEACSVMQDIHIAPKIVEKKPIQNYSEPQAGQTKSPTS